eukprot:472120_1
MNPMTEYGTELITTDITNPDKNHCKYSKKAVYCICVLFTLLLLSIFTLSYNYDHFMHKGGTLMAQIKTQKETNIENCANNEDISCDSKYGCCSYEEDIEKVTSNLVKQWDAYSVYVEDKTGEILGNGCIENKFNMKQFNCNDDCTSVGYIIDSDTPNICKNSFLDEMKSILKPYRRACIASLLSHQFSTLCGKKKDSSTSIELATFLWWKETYSVSPTWIHENCPYYI